VVLVGLVCVRVTRSIQEVDKEMDVPMLQGLKEFVGYCKLYYMDWRWLSDWQ
jgi:hypothetical protein